MEQEELKKHVEAFPGRKTFHVCTGNMTKEEAEEHVRKMMERYNIQQDLKLRGK